ncbi:hypothetical protein IQ07DRAFT_182329 [Pyrenochaeta sp. DS3sAY3a]|nr:hypothetical protein IQ07DRAFT_182329 [Pyrenochaeta sp. DS3sAY3a]
MQLAWPPPSPNGQTTLPTHPTRPLRLLQGALLHCWILKPQPASLITCCQHSPALCSRVNLSLCGRSAVAVPPPRLPISSPHTASLSSQLMPPRKRRQVSGAFYMVPRNTFLLHRQS